MHCESLIQPLPQKHICAIGCIHDSHCKNCATFLHLQYRCLDPHSGIAVAAKLHSFLESAQRCFELGAPAAFFELRLFISSSANDHLYGNEYKTVAQSYESTSTRFFRSLVLIIARLFTVLPSYLFFLFRW